MHCQTNKGAIIRSTHWVSNTFLAHAVILILSQEDTRNVRKVVMQWHCMIFIYSSNHALHDFLFTLPIMHFMNDIYSSNGPNKTHSAKNLEINILA